MVAKWHVLYACSVIIGAIMEFAWTLNRGRDALEGEFPFVVRIVVSDENSTIAQSPTEKRSERIKGADHQDIDTREIDYDPDSTSEDQKKVPASQKDTNDATSTTPGQEQVSQDGSTHDAGTTPSQDQVSQDGSTHDAGTTPSQDQVSQDGSTHDAGTTPSQDQVSQDGSTHDAHITTPDQGPHSQTVNPHIVDSTTPTQGLETQHRPDYDYTTPKPDEEEEKSDESDEEDDQDYLDEKISHERELEVGRVSAGILITLTRIFTTCDSVGFFTSQEVHLHNISRIVIVAGSIYKSGAGGQRRNPVKSSVHPFCYSLVSGVVLFNFGLFEIKTAFVSGKTIQPVKRAFQNGYDMEGSLKNDIDARTRCQTAGWGYPQEAFEGPGMPDRFPSTARILQATNTTLLNFPACYHVTCKKMGNCVASLWEYGYVCAMSRQGGPCMNDKGAPLVCNNVVYGIHTSQYACHDEGLPRYFLRIDLAYDYIHAMADLSTMEGSNVVVLLAAFYAHTINQMR